MDERQPPPVMVHPPVLFGVAGLLGLALEAMAPLGPGVLAGSTAIVVAGAALAAVGLIIGGLSVRGMIKGGTNIPTFQPALALVTGGIYRLSRNPMYLGALAFYLGMTLALSAYWGVVLALPVAIILHYGVVKREEPYLEALFGEPYRAYKVRTPRWI